MQVNELLVAPHLESIPSLRTFTTRSFPCSYSQSLGRHPNWSFHFEILFLRASDQVSTHLLQRLHVAAGEGDPNPVMATSGSMGVLPVSLKAMAAAWLPDRLVPRREQTVVSQKQDRAVQSSAAAATASSSKSSFFYC